MESIEILRLYAPRFPWIGENKALRGSCTTEHKTSQKQSLETDLYTLNQKDLFQSQKQGRFGE